MKKNKIITVISCLLLIGSLIGSLFLDDVIGSRVSNVVTIITAIIGAGALFVQFKKDKEINQASFVLEFSKQFYETYNCGALMGILEKYRLNKDTNINFDKNYETIVYYMQWVETLASLVKSRVVSIAKIDDLLSYRFFLIMNNKVVQEKEIVPCKEFYRGSYLLYEEWKGYKKKNNLPILLEENSLENTEGYKEVVEQDKRKNK